MKKVIFAIIVFLVLIGLGVFEQVYLRRVFDNISNSALEIRSLVADKNFDLAHEKAVELKEYWEKQKHITEALISHNETKEITMRLAEIEGYISAHDDKSAIATTAITAEVCDNLKHILGFCWDTVM